MRVLAAAVVVAGLAACTVLGVPSAFLGSPHAHEREAEASGVAEDPEPAGGLTDGQRGAAITIVLTILGLIARWASHRHAPPAPPSPPATPPSPFELDLGSD